MKKRNFLLGRVLPLLLSVGIMLSGSVVFAGAEGEAPAENENTAAGDTAALDIWDGTVAESYAGGNGSAEAPYLISTPEQLALLASSKGSDTQGKHYKLTADIYLNDITNEAWKDSAKQWVSTAEGAELYSCSVDGAGHIVYGLYITDNNNANGQFGLFKKIEASSISNLGIENSYIDTIGQSGAFVGWNQWSGNSSIKSCYISDTVSVKGKNAGGFIGWAHAISITDSYSMAVLSSCFEEKKDYPDFYGHTGGFIGLKAWDDGTGSFKNCYGTQKADPLSGGANDKPTYENCYTAYWNLNKSGITELKDEGAMIGVAAAKNMNSLDTANTWYITSDSYPRLRVFNKTAQTIGIWDGASIAYYESGSGTADEPFIIANASQLAYLAVGGNTRGKYYKLTNDIYLNDVSKENWSSGADLNSWFTGTAFEGTLEGDGHIIYGIYISDMTAANGGLFGKIDGGVAIKNIGIEDSFISVLTSAGAIAGCRNAWESATIEGCYSSDTVTVSAGTNAGGLVGNAPGNNGKVTFKNCYSSAQVVSGTRAGGIVGCSYNTATDKVSFINCYNTQISTRLVNSEYSDWANAAYENCYTTGDMGAYVKHIDPSNTVGALSVNNMPLGDAYYYNDASPKLKLFKKSVKVGSTWDGEAIEPLTGKGTAEEPYLISTPEQLAYLGSLVDLKGANDNNWNVYYKLTADIYLNDVSKNNWKEAAKEWRYGKDAVGEFSGNLDGDGHIIYGLYINDSDASNVGLFSKISNATVKKLGFEHIYLKALKTAGAVAGTRHGWCYSTTFNTVIEECYVGKDASISITSKTEGASGGIIGSVAFAEHTPGLSIKNCYSEHTTEGSRINGAIVGISFGANEVKEISNCYSANGAQIVGYDNAGSKYSFENCYITWGSSPADGITVVNQPEDMLGASAASGMHFDYDSIWYALTGESPRLLCFTELDTVVTGDVNMDGKVDIIDLVRLKKHISGIEDAVINQSNKAVTDYTAATSLAALREYLISGSFPEAETAAGKANLTNAANYKLVWGDDFSAASLSSNTWDEVKKTRDDGVTELTVEQSLESGNLKLENGQLTMHVSADDNGIKTTNDLTTVSTMNYRYGYLELRAKVPMAKGHWPSLWLQSVMPGSKNGALTKQKYTDYFVEVDVFEVFQNDIVVPNIWKWYNYDKFGPTATGAGKSVQWNQVHNNQLAKKTYDTSKIENYKSEFHTYGFEWTPTYMTMSVDGVNYNTFYFENNFDKGNKTAKVDGQWAKNENGEYYDTTEAISTTMEGFLEPMFLRIGNGVYNDAEHSCFNKAEDDYVIDYIKLYQNTTDYKDSQLWTK